MKKETRLNNQLIIKSFLIFLLTLGIFLNCTGCFLSSLFTFSEDKELILFVNSKEKIKVLQFADLHFGEEGTIYHNSDIERSLEFIDYAIQSENPDFIVLLGDNMMSQGVEGAKFIVETFDRYKIPYTFVFGNHDAELYLPGYTKSDVSNYLESCDSPYLLYKSGYIQNGRENRYGNFSVSIRDEVTNDLIGAFVIIDTGVYDYELGQYQSINDDQISWYEKEIGRLNDIYTVQTSNTLSTIPTITYGHIQLPEHAEAYQKAMSNDGAEFIYYQELPHWMPESVVSDSGKVNYGFFDSMKKMQSSKAYFCGHMHGLTYHVKTEGIILGFCPQACVTGNDSKTISTFSYTIDTNFEIELNLVVEP